jgi:hypothetical protein
VILPFCSTIDPFWIVAPAAVRIVAFLMTTGCEGNG